MESVLDRLIVQIYNEEMYDTVYNIYPFRSWIYTLYKFWGGARETFRDCVRFCYEHDIDGITTWNYYVTPELMQMPGHMIFPGMRIRKTMWKMQRICSGRDWQGYIRIV